MGAGTAIEPGNIAGPLDAPATATSIGGGTHTVAKGAVIGRVTDFFGNVIGEVKAPFDGEVMYVVGTPAMSKGEPVAMIATK